MSSVARAINECEIALALPVRTSNHIAWEREQRLFGLRLRLARRRRLVRLPRGRRPARPTDGRRPDRDPPVARQPDLPAGARPHRPGSDRLPAGVRRHSPAMASGSEGDAPYPNVEEEVYLADVRSELCCTGARHPLLSNTCSKASSRNPPWVRRRRARRRSRRGAGAAARRPRRAGRLAARVGRRDRVRGARPSGWTASRPRRTGRARRRGGWRWTSTRPPPIRPRCPTTR